MQEISVNKVVLIGRIDRDPELRYTQTNTAIFSMRVKTVESYVGRDGQPAERKATHSVIVWGQKGQMLKEQVRTNSRVYVEGRIQNRSYETSGGETRWVTEVVAQNAFALDSAPESQPQAAPQTWSNPPQQPSPNPSTQPPAQQPVQQPAPTADQPAPPVQQAPAEPEVPPAAPQPGAPSSSSSEIAPDDDLPF